jgi:hypothetical protein
MSNNPIPGAQALGFGFNSLGTYGFPAVTSQIFAHQSQDVETWTYQPTGITYNVPDNIAVEDSTGVSGQSYTFSNQEEFQSHFASSIHADISADFGTFQGAFDQAYGSDITRTGSYYYGIYEANYSGWTLVLEDQSQEKLSSAFTQDPDVQALLNLSPPQFTPQNAYLFYRVFNKFGTHFVYQVVVGGRLYYYEAVQTSYSSDQKQVNTNISLEYKAVFVDSSVQAQADWQTLGQQWSSSRTVSVQASGGDTGPLNALQPTYGTNANSIFTAWQQAVMGNPAVIELKLRPLSALFSGDLAVAIDEALTAYSNAYLSVMAEYQNVYQQSTGWQVASLSTRVVMNGQPIVAPMPSPPPPYPSYDPNKPVGFQLAIFGGRDLSILLNKFYYMQVFDAPAALQVYDTMYADISQITQTGYIVALAAMGVNNIAFPTGSFYDWLLGCGAELQQWQGRQGVSGEWTMCSYACVGQQGIQPGSAYEAYMDENNSEFGIARIFGWLQPPLGSGEGYTINASGLRRARRAAARAR